MPIPARYNRAFLYVLIVLTVADAVAVGQRIYPATLAGREAFHGVTLVP